MHCHEWSPGHNNIHTMMNILCFYFIYIFSINGIYFYQFFVHICRYKKWTLALVLMWSLLTCIAEQTLTLTWFCIFCKTNTDSFAAYLMVIVQVREQVVAAPWSTLQNFQGRSDICFILPGCLQPGITVVCLVSSQHWQNIQHTQVFTPLEWVINPCGEPFYFVTLSYMNHWTGKTSIFAGSGCSLCYIKHYRIFC